MEGKMAGKMGGKRDTKKGSKRGTKSEPKIGKTTRRFFFQQFSSTGYAKPYLYSVRSVTQVLARANNSKQQKLLRKLLDLGSNMLLGLGTPAYCDAPRCVAKQRGGSYSKMNSNRGQTIRARDKMQQQSSRAPLPTLPKPFPNLPKSSPNLSRRPLGAHLGPMLEKSSILNALKPPQSCPRAPKRCPTAAQALLKSSPRSPQIQFFSNFQVNFFHSKSASVFWVDFCQFLVFFQGSVP